MHKTFGADLRVARNRSGLSQEDCAHLLGVDQSQISRLEAGKAEPTLHELTLFYLIFGAWSEPLWNGLLREVVDDLRRRLITLPAEQQSWRQKAARRSTIQSLGRRLYRLSTEDDP